MRFFYYLVSACLLGGCLTPTAPPPERMPWALPSLDSTAALAQPDAFAWAAFTAINWPADLDTRGPDTSRALGDSGLVVWQTWKEAEEVYPDDGSPPAPWTTGIAAKTAIEHFSPFSIKGKLTDITSDPTFGLEEVRLNRSTFEYIVDNNLYNLNGQAARYASGDTINFPRASMELKVKWRQIEDSPQNKARYHWQYVTVDSSGQAERRLYGVVGIHLTSKVIQNWLWATFEHIDNRGQVHPVDDGWQLPSRDRLACAVAPYDCEGLPRGLGLEGTKWQYFRLRGTQTTYTTPSGAPVLLANSQVERGFQPSSSCMTCHNLATIGPTRGDTLLRIEFLPASPMLAEGFGGRGYVGVPDPALFVLPDGERYMQGDFVWSLARAQWAR